MSVTRARIEAIRSEFEGEGIWPIEEARQAMIDLLAYIDQPAPEMEVVGYAITWDDQTTTIEEAHNIDGRRKCMDYVSDAPLCLVSTATQAVEAERRKTEAWEKEAEVYAKRADDVAAQLADLKRIAGEVIDLSVALTRMQGDHLRRVESGCGSCDEYAEKLQVALNTYRALLSRPDVKGLEVNDAEKGR